MLRNSLAEVWRKKNVAGKCKLLSSQGSFRVTKVANKLYLPYLQLCGNALVLVTLSFGDISVLVTFQFW